MLDKFVRVEMGLTDPEDLSVTKNCFNLIVDAVAIANFDDEGAAEAAASTIRHAIEIYPRLTVADEE